MNKQESTEIQKELLLDQLWYKMTQIDACIRYTSLYYEKYVSKNYKGKLVKAFIVFLGILPFICNLLIVNEVINGKSIITITVLIIIMIIPVIIAVFGIDESSIKAMDSSVRKLMELNKSLMLYANELDKLWVEINADKKPISEALSEYSLLVQKHIGDEHNHNQYAGKIDHVLEAEAQKQSMEYLINKYKPIN